MTAVNKDQKKPDDKIVKFNFKHRTSRIGITAKTSADYSGTNNDGATIKITSAVLRGFNAKGTYSLLAPLSDASVNTATVGWTVDKTQPESISALSTSQTAKTLSTTAVSVFNDEGYLFVIPTSNSNIYLDITYEIKQGDVTYSESATLKREGIDLLMGHAYTFNVTIGLDAIEFTVETVETWGNGDGLNDTL
jgi:outer membrane receptor for ferrienterochelin and colicin